MWISAGRMNASVLPEPVAAMPDQVAAGKSHRPALRLDGRRGLEACLADHVQHVRWEGGYVEGEHWFGDVVALADDLVLLAPAIYFLLRHLRHRGMFLSISRRR